MIQASFFYDQAGVLRAFDFSGHAGFADRGFDIVCAAVSAIGQTVIGTMEELIGEALVYELDPVRGKIACKLEDYDRYTETEKIALGALMFSAYIGIEQLVPNYGEYIAVEKKTYLEEAHD
ncbi:MAG: ribosomal-processing cysteine protease Prp [Eubacteriales bacterium]|nr:ribosomal-processing cysteine protease Prp [Eubacteriales bacterium]